MLTDFKRALGAALLLPVLLLAVSGTGWAAWRCQYDGIARSVSCCPKKAALQASETNSAPTVGSAACCDFEQTQIEKAPSDLPRSQNTSTLDATVLATPVAVLTVELSPHRQVDLPVPQERPPGGPGLLLQKRSFLI